MSKLLHSSRSTAGAGRLLGLLSVLALTVSIAAESLAAPTPRQARDLAREIEAGHSLDATLHRYQAHGLTLVFTSATVPPVLTVIEPPTAAFARDQVEELLAPHGLTLRNGPGRRLIVVPTPLFIIATRLVDSEDQPVGGARLRLESGRWKRSGADGRALLRAARRPTVIDVEAIGYEPRHINIDPEASKPWPIRIVLEELPVSHEAIEALATWPRRLGETLSTLTIDGPAVDSLPLVGDDVIRALEQMPGTTSNERSARLSIRGNRTDETLVLLDGIELFEPFHLQDHGGTVSIIPPGLLGSVNLMTGAFPVDYGDRMAGVLTLTTREPPSAPRTHLAASLWDVQASSSGHLGKRLGYQASVRRGSLDLAYDLGDLDTDPTFWDALGKLSWALSPQRDLHFEILAADDKLRHEGTEDGRLETIRSRFDSTYLWADYQAIIGRRLSSHTALSFTRIERVRAASIEDSRGALALDDSRQVDVSGVAQRFGLQLGSSGGLRAGVDIRRLEVDYDQVAERLLRTPSAYLGRPPTDDIVFAGRFDGSLVSGFLSARLEPSPGKVLEIGARFDENSIAEDHLLSPRAAFAWNLGEATSLRAAYGFFFQSHRLYELEATDGEQSFQPAERAQRAVIGLDHRLGGRTTLRAEIYGQTIDEPRIRFENLFDPVSFTPELEADRIRIEADSSRAFGLELSAEGGGRKLGWMTSYTLSRIEDEIDGRHVPRSIDQTHALRLDLDVVLGRFDIAIGWQFHTGWPTTAIDAEVDQGPDGPVAVPVLGPLYGERLPDYHRLDVRLSRRFQLSLGSLEAFVEVQNLYNRRNLRGFDLDLAVAPDGRTAILEREPEAWGGIFPRVGLRWTF